MPRLGDDGVPARRSEHQYSSPHTEGRAARGTGRRRAHRAGVRGQCADCYSPRLAAALIRMTRAFRTVRAVVPLDMQRAKLEAWALADDVALGGCWWTRARVATLIGRKLGIRYHPGHVSKLLRQGGWRPQKPEWRARQRDEAVIDRWRAECWPAIKKDGHDATAYAAVRGCEWLLSAAATCYGRSAASCSSYETAPQSTAVTWSRPSCETRHAGACIWSASPATLRNWIPRSTSGGRGVRLAVSEARRTLQLLMRRPRRDAARAARRVPPPPPQTPRDPWLPNPHESGSTVHALVSRSPPPVSAYPTPSHWSPTRTIETHCIES